MSGEDEYSSFMLEAVALSRNGFGFTAPNPCVGALLVKNGYIVAEGWHKAAGEPHAERVALEDASNKGVDPSQCTMVVTLEPCKHHGRTPPCTDAILAAGIRHVVIGCLDPTPEAGGGAEVLRSHGVRVDTGVEEQACLDNIADFLQWRGTEYPYVLLKLASSLDGRIATQHGHSQWITGAEARQEVQFLRSRMDAVMVGAKTLSQDNPRLTVRPESGEEPERQPLAVVVSTRLPDQSQPLHILQDRPGDAVFFTTKTQGASPAAQGLRGKGVKVYGLDVNEQRKVDLTQALRILRSEHNVNYLLCEGGGKLALALLRYGLVNEFHLHLSPKILGDNQAVPLFDGLSTDRISDALEMRYTSARFCGHDLIVTLRP